MTLEIACFDLESALAAADAGADRLELCAAPREGGLTPTPALVRAVKASTSVPVAAMVRCRGGDFVYSSRETALMQDEARALLDAGADALVFGALRPDGTVATDEVAAMVALAHPAPLAFHRAFDAAPDPFAALDGLVALGVARVLTAGGPGSAVENQPQLAAFVRYAAGRLVVMPGGGVRAANVRAMAEATGAREFHSAARRILPPTHLHGEARDAVDSVEVAALRHAVDEVAASR